MGRGEKSKREGKTGPKRRNLWNWIAVNRNTELAAERLEGERERESARVRECESERYRFIGVPGKW